MKTNKELQLEIINRIKDNIINDRYLFDGIFYFNFCENEWKPEKELNALVLKNKTYKVVNHESS